MNRVALRFYAQFYKGNSGLLTAAIASSIVGSLFLLPVALLVQHGIDTAIPASDFRTLLLIGLAILVLYILDSGVALLTRYLALKVTKIAIQRLRDELLKRLYAFPRAVYTEADLSTMHASIVQDSERVDVMSNSLVAQVLPALIASALLSVVMIFLNWVLFLALIVAIPLLYVASVMMRTALRKRVRAFHRSFETFSKGVLFVLQSMDLTRIQTAEAFEIERQGKHVENLRVTSTSMAWMQTAYSQLQDLIVAISWVIVLVVGGYAVATGSMSIGALLSFYIAVGILRGYLGALSYHIPQVLAGMESLETLRRTGTADHRLPYNGTRRIAFGGEVRLEGVDFAYGDKPLLRDISLWVRPGSTLAVVGPNGAGKSTIVNLVLGFYRPQRGILFADGVPFDDLDMVSLRRQIGVVTQDPILFAGTVAENISYGTPDATQQQIERAARAAAADRFIHHLPQGYESLIGEHGVRLSGGQRQRIAIARALLRQPPLLIMDEPTNHLDAQAIVQFVASLKSMKGAPAVLLISHDVGILQVSDELLSIRDGRIVACGPTSSLLPEIVAGRAPSPFVEATA
jgi:ABC-type multidrug transport system fused ATPase/permease subunit